MVIMNFSIRVNQCYLWRGLGFWGKAEDSGLTTSLLQVVPRAQPLFLRSVAFFLSAHEIFGRTWGREAQNTILHAAPASNGRIYSARSHGCQVRVRRLFRHLSIGSGRLHRIWPFAPPREGILFQPPID